MQHLAESSMSRRRRARAFVTHTTEPARRDLARWRSFTHRGTRLEFVVTGVVVTAATPAELLAETDAAIVRRTERDPEN
jgi:hypothetical protein